MVLAILAVCLFTCAGFQLFGLLLFEGPVGGLGGFLMLVLTVVSLPVLVVVGWAFMARFLWLSRRAKAAVDAQMRACLGDPV